MLMYVDERGASRQVCQVCQHPATVGHGLIRDQLQEEGYGERRRLVDRALVIEIAVELVVRLLTRLLIRRSQIPEQAWNVAGRAVGVLEAMPVDCIQPFQHTRS